MLSCAQRTMACLAIGWAILTPHSLLGHAWGFSNTEIRPDPWASATATCNGTAVLLACADLAIHTPGSVSCADGWRALVATIELRTSACRGFWAGAINPCLALSCEAGIYRGTEFWASATATWSGTAVLLACADLAIHTPGSVSCADGWRALLATI